MPDEMVRMSITTLNGSAPNTAFRDFEVVNVDACFPISRKFYGTSKDPSRRHFFDVP
ncbi:hypothetical protein F4827_005009 [Paraburkholderia bannensis]|uniref:Uncharacterized protein n=1 Tax=Paraburkholderia bannensis TaxID=765414 RepID=A0A7W9U1F6_9BURK|nr:hypothetical protein [Paraburkholderia sp. WP4_3_2]MBB6105144.1 hypothetical protein [Paraburkholderia bannensis]